MLNNHFESPSVFQIAAGTGVLATNVDVDGSVVSLIPATATSIRSASLYRGAELLASRALG